MAVFWPTPCYQENIHQLWVFHRGDLKISVSAVPHYKDTLKTETESCTDTNSNSWLANNLNCVLWWSRYSDITMLCSQIPRGWRGWWLRLVHGLISFVSVLFQCSIWFLILHLSHVKNVGVFLLLLETALWSVLWTCVLHWSKQFLACTRQATAWFFIPLIWSSRWSRVCGWCKTNTWCKSAVLGYSMLWQHVSWWLVWCNCGFEKHWAISVFI